jgi:hypothetical protein
MFFIIYRNPDGFSTSGTLKYILVRGPVGKKTNFTEEKV